MERKLRGIRKSLASHHPQAAEQEWSGQENNIVEVDVVLPQPLLCMQHL